MQLGHGVQLTGSLGDRALKIRGPFLGAMVGTRACHGRYEVLWVDGSPSVVLSPLYSASLMPLGVGGALKLLPSCICSRA